MKHKKKYNWGSIGFLMGYQLLMVALLPIYFIFFGAPSIGIVVTSILLYLVSGLSITGGYHRLFAHSTYKANKVVKFFYLFFGTMACQGSALRWVNDHRLHHAHVDEEDDPYSVTRGFWHAHLFWMFEQQPPIKEKVVSDLLRSKMIRFQDKYYAILMFSSNLIVTLFIGFCTGNYFEAFLFTWLVRQFFLHHCTWFINSLAHYFGHQNYSTEHTAVDNYFISFLTFGEGYHNYHHTFAYDYRNGIRWYHFDPTKWLIWGLKKLGLAKSLRTVPEAKISEQMIKIHKNALLDKLKNSLTNKKGELEEKVTYYTDSLTRKINQMNTLIREYKKTKMDSTQLPDTLKKLSLEMAHLKKSLKHEWRAWKRFSRSVMKLEEAA